MAKEATVQIVSTFIFLDEASKIFELWIAISLSVNDFILSEEKFFRLIDLFGFSIL